MYAVLCMNVYMYAGTYVCMYICMYVCIVYAGIYVCLYEFVFLCMNVCMYVCMSFRLLQNGKLLPYNIYMYLSPYLLLRTSSKASYVKRREP